MTAQKPDQVKYRRTSYDLCGLPEGALFNPEEYGLKPHWFMTSCWRGYICYFKIASKQLLLENLWIGFDTKETLKAKHGRGKEIFGKLPEIGEYCFEYKNLNLPISFTGSFLLCKDFIRELYIHAGYFPAWKYEKVLELSLENGKVVCVEDKSEQIEVERKQNINLGLWY